jgi:ABC-type sugar transport system permease subunit
VQHHPFPLIALVLVPLLGLLFAGLATKTIGKGNFWAIFTIAFFSEVVAILLFLFLITI